MDKELQINTSHQALMNRYMSKPFAFQNSLYDAVTDPDSGILSKLIDSDDFARVTLFGIAAGEELTEHTAPRQAYVQIFEGKGEISLGNEQHPVQAGTWVRMSPNQDTFCYRLRVHAGDAVILRFAACELLVSIPAAWARELATTEKVGFATEVITSPETSVHLTVEKDFQCLVERPEDKDGDPYPNPEASVCGTNLSRK